MSLKHDEAKYGAERVFWRMLYERSLNAERMLEVLLERKLRRKGKEVKWSDGCSREKLQLSRGSVGQRCVSRRNFTVLYLLSCDLARASRLGKLIAR